MPRFPRLLTTAPNGAGATLSTTTAATHLAAALLGTTLTLAAGNAAALTLNGPMVGPAALREARIWLQTDAPAQVAIEYWQADKKHQRSAPQTLRAGNDYSTIVTLAGLQPGQTYRYRVLANGKPLGAPDLSFSTQTLWQWRTDPPAFKVVTGSCAYINDAAYDRPGKPYGNSYAIFDRMAEQQPALTVWLGDNLYFREVDYDSASGMAARYRVTRALPELQKLLRTGQHAAIWDDHDYGPNDSNRSFALKDVALDLFKRNWVNPGYGLPETPGVFGVVSYNDVDFFLLDDRYYRDSDHLGAADMGMFGAAQMRWLKNALLASTANYKIIASGSPLFDNRNVYESWNHFPQERNDFLAWLDQAHVDGVLFLSGDRHHTELLREERPGHYPLFELTCSSLTAGTHTVAGEADKPDLVPGTLLGDNNFCTLEFSGKRTARTLTLKAFDVNGQQRWQQELPRSLLQDRTTPAP